MPESLGYKCGPCDMGTKVIKCTKDCEKDWFVEPISFTDIPDENFRQNTKQCCVEMQPLWQRTYGTFEACMRAIVPQDYQNQMDWAFEFGTLAGLAGGVADGWDEATTVFGALVSVHATSTWIHSSTSVYAAPVTINGNQLTGVTQTLTHNPSPRGVRAATGFRSATGFAAIAAGVRSAVGGLMLRRYAYLCNEMDCVRYRTVPMSEPCPGDAPTGGAPTPVYPTGPYDPRAYGPFGR